MPEKLVISENCCNFIVFNYKELHTIIAMITEDKVMELFCMADDFCKFFEDCNLQRALATVCDVAVVKIEFRTCHGLKNFNKVFAYLLRQKTPNAAKMCHSLSFFYKYENNSYVFYP